MRKAFGSFIGFQCLPVAGFAAAAMEHPWQEEQLPPQPPCVLAARQRLLPGQPPQEPFFST